VSPSRGHAAFRRPAPAAVPHQFGGVDLGVLRDVDQSQSLVAILGITSHVFDIMSAGLNPAGASRQTHGKAATAKSRERSHRLLRSCSTRPSMAWI